MTEITSWYEITNGKNLEQGDLLRSVPMVEVIEDFAWPSENSNPSLDDVITHEVDAVIMSQSCDLNHPNKLKFVAFCPIYQLEELTQFEDAGSRNNLRQGKYVALHLLNKCVVPGHEQDFLVVDFRRIFSLPIGFTRNWATKQGNRLRLKSPYKEHLAQAFARYFMRIGLPSDIPEFEKKKKTKM